MNDHEWAYSKQSQNMAHSRNGKDENLVFKKIQITFTKYVKLLGILLDKNLTFAIEVQRVLGNIAKQISFINRLRHFTRSSVMIRFYNIYMKPNI